MNPADLVGKTGEFLGSDGEVYQCVVTGTDPKLRRIGLLLVIDYVRNGEKITGAYIAPESFRPDEPETKP